MMNRTSGILLHISSLPSPYGIGTLGREAYRFADFLHASGQHYWQILPIGPTSYGDSPYQSCSTHAGNPYFIDLDLLCEAGLLTPEELAEPEWPADGARVDYGFQYRTRYALLRKAYARGAETDAEAFAAFWQKNPWVRDYAVYMALKQANNMQRWDFWPEAQRRHTPEALAEAEETLTDEVGFYAYIQYLFFSQWEKLRSYIHSLGIEIIGDLPIYVPLDSCDVWANQDLFQLDRDGKPTGVAGVPPDYFSEDGQLWGNPLYDWEKMAQDNFGWWRDRVAGAGRLFDVIRIDHFRGLEAYWRVPYGDETAKGGSWLPGPGLPFIACLREAFPDLKLIAEDLGMITPEVRELRDASGFPGMKVLAFAFDPSGESDYLPHRYPRNCICYAGTHDNETLVQWKKTAPKETVAFACEYLGVKKKKLVRAILRAGMTSVADTFIAQLQDWLELGAEARMNFPGTATSDNWTWRMDADACTPELAASIRRMTELYGRCERLPEQTAEEYPEPADEAAE